jgi:hypothetical protein
LKLKEAELSVKILEKDEELKIVNRAVSEIILEQR